MTRREETFVKPNSESTFIPLEMQADA